MRSAIVLGLMLAVALPPVAAAEEEMTLAQTGRSCKQVSSCEEAVRIWCEGYRRADGDGDGIPCENVCSSIEEVERIRADIGC